ncbi:MAG: hypothetical protein HRU29_15635 [Rhizobiales bacterium]|nr:hypothetical protein [Hyphomicrobiales bacterium]NRB15828.1 hypothetical protein [Hyphomicrobiales bacterium]
MPTRVPVLHSAAQSSFSPLIIANPKTMVTYVRRSKDRIFHPRFMARMNHYVIEPVACTPSSGWEKGRVVSQVQHIRKWLFTPKLKFDNMQNLNEWLHLKCIELGCRTHPVQKDQTIDTIFKAEHAELRPVCLAFEEPLVSWPYSSM